MYLVSYFADYTYSYGVQHNLQGKCTNDRLERMLHNKLQTEKHRLKSGLDKSTKGLPTNYTPTCFKSVNELMAYELSGFQSQKAPCL